MSWATPEDVKDAWIGDGAPDDDELIQKWIDKAERLVRRQVPDLQARIDAEQEQACSTLLDLAVDVVVAMVIRVFRNPDGIRTQNTTQTTGPFSDTTSQTYGGDVPGGLALTAAELDSLSGGSDGAYEIDLVGSHAGLLHAHRWFGGHHHDAHTDDHYPWVTV